MSTLANFPMVSQLTTITSDGRPSENAQFDCVPASIGAAILWYEGKHQWDTTINPDLLKDKAYNEALRNSGTAADHYVNVVKAMGYDLFHFDGNSAALLKEARSQIQALHPVVFTEIDPYVPLSRGWSHVCVFYGENPGELTALDPYIGKPVIRSDAEWEKLLLAQQIWIVQKEAVVIDIHNAEIAKHYKELNVHQWQSIETGKIIQYAMLANYKAEGNQGLCGWDVLRAPVSNEIPLDSSYPHGSVKQFYECGVRWWNAATGKVLPLALYVGPGQDPRIAELTATVATLQKQLSSAPDNVALQQELDVAKTKLAAVAKAIL